MRNLIDKYCRKDALLIVLMAFLLGCQGPAGVPETRIGCLADYDLNDPVIPTGQTYQTGRACAAAINSANNCTLATISVAQVLANWALTCAATCRAANPACTGTLINQDPGTEACHQVMAGAAPGETPYWFMVCKNVTAKCQCD